MKKLSLRPFALSLLILPFLISGAEQESKKIFSFDNTNLILVTGANIAEPSTFAKEEDISYLALATPAEASLKKAQGFNGFVFGKAGEDDLTRACKELITSNGGNYEIGTAVVTPSFNLRDKGYQNIIHSPAPQCDWYQTQEVQHNALGTCYTNILKAVWKLGLRGVATVPFGTGIAGYTHKDSAKLLAAAISSLKEHSSDTKRVYVIYNSKQDLEDAASTITTFQKEL